MIPLDSPLWAQLEHAYGSAGDIPPLLKQLSGFPKEGAARAEPFHSLWSSLCHQDDVFSASLAAVPHIVKWVEHAPKRASLTYYALPTAIEIDRAQGRGPLLPPDCEAEYFASLRRLSELAEGQLVGCVDELRARYLKAAVAVGRGEIDFASQILDPDED